MPKPDEHVAAQVVGACFCMHSLHISHGPLLSQSLSSLQQLVRRQAAHGMSDGCGEQSVGITVPVLIELPLEDVAVVAPDVLPLPVLVAWLEVVLEAPPCPFCRSSREMSEHAERALPRARVVRIAARRLIGIIGLS